MFNSCCLVNQSDVVLFLEDEVLKEFDNVKTIPMSQFKSYIESAKLGKVGIDGFASNY
jgi:hypothetical protein